MPTEYQDSSETLDCSSLQCLCEWQNLTLLATSEEAEGRADYQQTDTTSISANLARMVVVSTKRGQGGGWANCADNYTEGGGLTSIQQQVFSPGGLKCCYRRQLRVG
jgi:hypothetical protein